MSRTEPLERLPETRRLVRRSALFDVLSSAGDARVVLVCAPPGSGKTVLLRSWAQSGAARGPVAWVSVERGEEDAQHFWLAVIDALATAASEEGLVERVGAAPAFRGKAVIDQLLSNLHTLTEPVVLVIDDLHELRSTEALELLERFLERAPATARVIMATRKDPPLGLHRLRLTSGLIEIRAADLRFSLEETRKLLQADGIELSDEAVALLHARAEGWAAGLRLAAISLARHPDPERFVAEFSGSERTVAGYLLAEVLERQPPEVRELLLRTSVLERVSGPLGDFLTGHSGSEAILQELEDANAFVVALDARRTWFRYHHLFAELLRLELRRTAPATVPLLHRTAAQWFEEHGHPVDAIRHAQEAGDWPVATRLLADHGITLVFDGRIATVDALLAAFPRHVRVNDPELALVIAKARLHDGRVKESGTCISAAERLADAVPDDRRRGFELRLAEIRLALARRRGDLAAALAAMDAVQAALAAQPATDGGPGNDLEIAALMNLGIAELWASGLDDARAHLEQALELARRFSRPYLEIGCLAHLAIAAPLAGLPARDALELSERAMTIAEEHGWSEDPVSAAPLGIRAIVLLWLGRFAEAEHCLVHARRIVRSHGEPDTELIVDHATGLLSMVCGRFDEAFAAFADAERMQALLASDHSFSAERRSRIAQMHAWMGRTDAARDALATMTGEEHDVAGVRIAEAAILLTEDDPLRALEVLGPVIECSERALKGDWAAIEGLLLGALAHERLGDRRAATAAVERALELAEPEGVLLPFVAIPVRELLERHPRPETAHGALLSEIRDVLDGALPRRRGEIAPLRDELSGAELRVVRYLPSNLRAPEIAAELCVSPNTVRTHLRHIYSKLDAHTRTEAVERARDLGLLAPSSRLH